MIFLLAVFCVFVGIGFANDSIDMGHEPRLRFAISAVLTGLFAVVYASGGVILRRKFWKLFIPVFLVQMGAMILLSNSFPERRQPVQLDKAEITRLRNRLAFDGTGIVILVGLGYAGFVHVAISESRRYVGAETERAKLEAEMTAAREIQRVMVPDELPVVPGYAIESAYRPAAQVGGDFFQVMRLKSGRTLIVIGDVSGKGLSAAMIVSMVIGMLSSVTSFTEEPCEVLGELNKRLFGRVHGGFATSLAVRIAESGQLTVANAGHLPPYLNASEVTLPGSMPLGLVEGAEYGQTTLKMNSGDRLVLLTDGIPEARKDDGPLFGFARVESMLRIGVTAAELAESAEEHGQNDDLTVISVTRES